MNHMQIWPRRIRKTVFLPSFSCVNTTVWIDHVGANKAHKGCPRGVMVKVLDCGIVVSRFELQSRVYVHFRTNSTTTVLLEGWLWHYITQEGWYDIKQQNKQTKHLEKRQDGNFTRVQFWNNPASNIPQSKCRTATCLPSLKPSK